jgi:hypothetical protein
MTGEKAADHILGEPLSPSNQEPWINPRWMVSIMHVAQKCAAVLGYDMHKA